MSNDRSSEADLPQLINDPREVARVEAENTLRQFDDSMSELAKWINNSNYKFRVSTILRFNRIALQGVSAHAGIFRPSSITISGSSHVPPNAEDVPELMEDLCDYIQENWLSGSAIHLSAYALWRLNWIHPFVDGNGRTARSISYLILCAKLGYRLPGGRTIAEQIASNKKPYYEALEAADKSSASKVSDVSDLESLLSDHLASQLLHIHDMATGAINLDRAAKAALLPPVISRADTQHRPIGHLQSIVKHVEKHPVLYGGGATIVIGILAIIFQK